MWYPGRRKATTKKGDDMMRLLYRPYVDTPMALGLAYDLSRVTWDIAPVEIDRSDPMDYPRHFMAWWDFGEGFMIAEQDVEVEQQAIYDLESCGYDWCWHGYAGDGQPGGPHFGLVRFSISLVRAFPDLGASAYSALNRPSRRANGWRALAGEVGNMLHTLGVQPHRHYPNVVHHHEYQ